MRIQASSKLKSGVAEYDINEQSVCKRVQEVSANVHNTISPGIMFKESEVTGLMS